MKNSMILLVLGALMSTLDIYVPETSGYVQYAFLPILVGSALAGLASGVGNVLSGIFNEEAVEDTNDANLQATRETNAQNRELFNQQLDYNTQMYENQKAYNNELIEKMNDYNTPANQMQRYRDAGINPYFALGNIDSGQMQNAVGVTAPTAGAAPTMQAPHFQAPNYDFIGNVGRDIASVMGNYFTYENLHANTEAQMIDNLTRFDENIARLEHLRSQKDLSDAERDRLDEQITDMRQQRNYVLENMRLGNENLRNSNKLQEYEKQLKVIEVKTSRLQNEYQSWFNEFSKERGAKELEQLSSIIANTEADSALKYANKVLSECQKEGVHLDNTQKKTLLPLLERAHRLDNERKALENKYGTNAYTSIPRYGENIRHKLGYVWSRSRRNQMNDIRNRQDYKAGKRTVHW